MLTKPTTGDNKMINREQAIKEVGIKMVEKLEKENCDFTNRVIEEEGLVEFRSSIDLEDGRILFAYYYQTQEDLDEISNNGDELDSLDWEISHYKCVLI